MTKNRYNWMHTDRRHKNRRNGNERVLVHRGQWCPPYTKIRRAMRVEKRKAKDRAELEAASGGPSGT